MICLLGHVKKYFGYHGGFFSKKSVLAGVFIFYFFIITGDVNISLYRVKTFAMYGNVVHSLKMT